jgi:hypothetical protein
MTARTLGLLACLVAVPCTAGAARKITIRVPTTTIGAGEATEGCYFVRIPGATPFDLGSWQIVNRPRGVTVLHTIVYLYRGERLDEFATQARQVIFSKGCLDLGPADRDSRQMIAAITAVNVRGAMPSGVALRLDPVPASPGGPADGIGLLVDLNWQNTGTRMGRPSSKIVLKRAKPGAVRRLAHPFVNTGAGNGLDVPPFAVRSTEDSTAALNAARLGVPPERDVWAPAADACVVTLAPRLHKRARFFGADILGTDGLVHNPPGGVPDPFDASRRHFYGANDYTDPGLRVLLVPQLVRAGEAIHYFCWHDNGATRALRFGCEETAAVPPGVPIGLPGGGPAKPCATGADCPATDAAYPGRAFTGACVPANLVAGTTPDDEVCGVTGTYFDAVPGAATGAECDVSTLPPITPKGTR